MPDGYLHDSARPSRRVAHARPCLALACAGWLAGAGHGVHAQSLASETPRIAEPMVFDLVRPLGARAGEREVNALTFRPFRATAPTNWAPEFEYAYADGESLEIELPFADDRLVAYKFALQGTFGTGAGGRFIHGWQAITLYDREAGRIENSLLYIAGYRFDARWSVLGMVGIEKAGLREAGPTSLLFNPSVFYDLDPLTVLGIEVNLRRGIALDDTTRCLVIPQVQRRLTETTSLQIGVGAQFETRRDPGLVAAMRLIQEF